MWWSRHLKTLKGPGKLEPEKGRDVLLSLEWCISLLSAAMTYSTAKPGEERVYFSSEFIVHHERSQSRNLEGND